MLSAIQNRRSVRQYLEKPLPRSVLDEIIQAGRLAPSGGNSQSCHFIVIQNSQVIARLNALAQAEFAGMDPAPDMYRSLRASIQQAKKGRLNFTYGAPVLVVVANQAGYCNAMADSAVAIENMMLEATAQGIGSCWLNQLHWLDQRPSIRREMLSLGLDEAETICGAVALGYSNQPLRPPLPRHGNPVTFID